MDTMKVGLIGLGTGGQQVAEALLASSWCELIAVASRKSQRIERFTAEHTGIATYDDYRSLIVENRLDALFVAIPPFLRGKYLTLAADRALPVWMLTPAARRFDEAVAIMERFERADCPLVVCRSWGLEPALQPDSMGVEQLGRIFFARGNVMTCLPEDLDWRGDSVRAGGGVLLNHGYALIDTVVQIMGMPGTVYAAGAGVSRPGARFPYDTEDTAAAVCQFSGGEIALLSACWTAGPQRWVLELHGTEGSVRIDDHHVLLRDRTGRTRIAERKRPANPFTCQIEEFITALRSNVAGLRSIMRQHLPTVAVIQAAYLSARTGQPESPGTIVEMHDI